MIVEKFNVFMKMSENHTETLKVSQEKVDSVEKENMATQNIYHIYKKAKKIHNYFKSNDGEDIPEWIQEMLASLNDRMNTISDYMGYGEKESETLDSDAVNLDMEEDDEDDFNEPINKKIKTNTKNSELLGKDDTELEQEFIDDSVELEESHKQY